MRDAEWLAACHTVALLQKLNFKDYGTLTVLVNGDEEISSPGWRSTTTPLATDQDALFSFEGGGTDAAIAGLKTQGAVVEGIGLSGYGAHSSDAEYVQIGTIVPRLVLATRMVMDVSRDRIRGLGAAAGVAATAAEPHRLPPKPRARQPRPPVCRPQRSSRTARPSTAGSARPTPGSGRAPDEAHPPHPVFADLFSRADGRAGALAEALDRSHAAGLRCHRDYDALEKPSYR